MKMSNATISGKSYINVATSVVESTRHTCGQCSVVLPRAPASTISTASHSSNPKSILSIS